MGFILAEVTQKLPKIIAIEMYDTPVVLMIIQ